MSGAREDMRPKLLVWSAADEGGLVRLAESYAAHLSQLASSLSATEAGAYLSDLAYTLAVRRSSLNWKSFVVAGSVFDLHDLTRKLSKPVRSRVDPKLGYIFTGQGAQFAQMSKDLLGFPTYLESLRRSEMYLDDIGCQWSLLGSLKHLLFASLTFYLESGRLVWRSELPGLSSDQVRCYWHLSGVVTYYVTSCVSDYFQGELLKDKDTSNVNNPAYSQPLCTALQIALVDLLRSFKVIPSAVVGHSSGEIAAA